MRTQTAILLALSLSTIGCGDDSPSLSWNKYCQERATSECTNVAAACYISQPDCESVRSTLCIQDATQALAIKHAFNASNAKTCLAKVNQVFSVLNPKRAQPINTIAANEYTSIDEACERVFQGPSKANQPCTQDSDCAGKLTCDKGFCGTTKIVPLSPGLCANPGEACPQGNFCSLTSSPAQCRPRPVIGSNCDASTPCLESYRCAANVCAERLPLGSDCLVSDDCENPNNPAASGFCDPFARKCSAGVQFAYFGSGVDYMGSPACMSFAGKATPTRGTTPSPDAAVTPVAGSPDAAVTPALIDASPAPATVDATPAPASTDASSN